jgi:hypothetical protein
MVYPARGTTSKEETMMKTKDKLLWSAVAALMLLGIAIAVYQWWPRKAPPGFSSAPAVQVTQPETAPTEVAAAASEPVVQHPIETQPSASAPAAAAATLPALGQSDKTVRAALDGLLGRRSVLTFVQFDGFVRRVVATVDSLPRDHAAPRVWPVNPSPGRFTTSHNGSTETIGASNAERYTPFVDFIESVEVARAKALYVRLYPLFQQAWVELGYPRGYFNDRVVEVIDHLLAAPEPGAAPEVRLTQVKGPIKPIQPWTRYEFADPAFEALSAGQKIMLRVGPGHEARLKAKLREFRKALATGTPR